MLNTQNILKTMEIEPEKEIVLMVVSKEKTEGIVEVLRGEYEIDSPGKGVIFIQNVSSAYGLTD